MQATRDVDRKVFLDMSWTADLSGKVDFSLS